MDVVRVTTLEELAVALKHRRYALGLSQLAAEEIAGMTGGHLAKIECGMKGLGKISLPLMLGALKVELALVSAASIDRDKTAKKEGFFSMRARKAANARWNNLNPKQRRKQMRAVQLKRWAKVMRERERGEKAAVTGR